MDRFLHNNPDCQTILSALIKDRQIPAESCLVVNPFKESLTYFGMDELRRAVFPNNTVVGKDGTQMDPEVPQNLTIFQINRLTDILMWDNKPIIILTEGVPFLCDAGSEYSNLIHEPTPTLSDDLLYDALRFLTTDRIPEKRQRIVLSDDSVITKTSRAVWSGQSVHSDSRVWHYTNRETGVSTIFNASNIAHDPDKVKHPAPF